MRRLIIVGVSLIVIIVIVRTLSGWQS